MKIAGVSGILGWEEAPVLWGSPSPRIGVRGRPSIAGMTSGGPD